MSVFDDPFDPNSKLARRCSCGAHASQGEHDAAERAARDQHEARAARMVDAAVMRALFCSNS